MKLRIGIDARLLNYRRGMGNYVCGLLRALAEIPAPHEFLLYTDKPFAKDVVPRDPRFHTRVLKPGFYPVWEQVLLPLAVRRDRLDLLHCPANTGPVYKIGVPVIITIHDVIFLFPRRSLPLSPSLYQRLGRLYRRLIVPPAARAARMILTDSECSKKDIERLIKPFAPIDVVYLAAGSGVKIDSTASETEAVLSRHGIRCPYILAFGAADPRKNTMSVIRAFARIADDLPVRHQLVLIGVQASASKQIEQSARSSGVGDRIVIAGFVPEQDIAVLYRKAVVLVFPSLYEGFGLPMLEAMMHETPVVASRVGSLPEVGGDAVEWVDPLSVDSIALGIRKVLTDQALADRLRRAGRENVRRFSWENTAKKALQCYEEVGQAVK